MPVQFRNRMTAAAMAALLLVAPAASALADPPPWAPAHGWRDKHDKKHGKHKDKDKDRRGDYYRYDDRYGDRYEHRDRHGSLPWFYGLPIGIDGGRCDRGLVGANLGTVLGAVAGGLGGSQIGKGDGRVAATIGGVLLGAFVGNAIGRQMQPADQGCLAQTLERAPTGQPILWDNPDAGSRYEVIPTRTWEQAGGTFCRDYTSRVIIGNRTETATGTACRQPDGAWQIMN